MTNIIGYQGIHIDKLDNTQVESDVYISVTPDIIHTTEYVEQLKNCLGHLDGYDLGELIHELTREVEKLKVDRQMDLYYRLNNPAVEAAWEHYQTMLTLAKEDNQ